jgi:hypothetical protein
MFGLSCSGRVLDRGGWVQSLANHYLVRGNATHMSGDQGSLLVELFSTVYLQKEKPSSKELYSGGRSSQEIYLGPDLGKLGESRH